MPPMVSWILPVKNGMPFLPDTLASLAAQTYRDFQVLAWDNGSTDGTIEELNRWIPSRLPGKIITDQPRSVGGALRELVELADTEFCARIDADDICRPDRLELQVSFLQAHPEIALVGSRLRIIDEQSRLTGTVFDYPLSHDEIVHELLVRNPIGHPSVLCRRAALLAAGNYDGSVVLEDYDLWLRLACRHKLANLPGYLVDYRIHPQSAMRRIEKEKKAELLLQETFSKHALALFGLTPQTARRLQSRQSSNVILLAVKIAKHLSRTQGDTTWARLRNPVFVENLRSTTRIRDVLSRFSFALLDCKAGSITREAGNLFITMLKKIPGGPSLIEAIRARRARRHRHLWLHAQTMAGCNIHERINFIGLADGHTRIKTKRGLRIEPDVTIWIAEEAGANSELNLGADVFIGRHTFLGVYQPITIGKNVLIGAYCYIISANHNISRRDLPIVQQGFVGAPIVIEEDAWLGTHVVVLPGVTIGRGAVVGAGSVVTGDIPAWEIWGGVPARFIKRRPE